MRLVLVTALLFQLGSTTLPTVLPLHQAAALGRVQAVKLFLAAGANAAEKDGNGLTPVEIALARAEKLGDANSFVLNALLLRATAGINGRDPQGWTALHHAVVSDDEELVRELIKDGAHALRGRGQSVFEVAKIMKSEAMLLRILAEEDKLPYAIANQIIKYNLQPVVEDILSHTKSLPPAARAQLAISLNDMEALRQAIEDSPRVWVSNQRITAKIPFRSDLFKERILPQLDEGSLHHAAAHGDVDAVAAWLDSGIDIDAIDAYGWTALRYAVFAEQEAVVRQLCDADAYVWQVNDNGFSLALLAEYNLGKDAAVVKILTRSNNRRRNESWLNFYVRVGNTDKAISYIEAQAEPQVFVNAEHKNEWLSLGNALHVAAKHGDLALFRYLIEEMRMSINHKVLIEIAIGNHANIARYLLSREVAITHADPEEVGGGFTLLHYAAWHGSLAMVELLVEELGADINVAASNSSYKARDISPLQAAARHDNNLPVVQFLVEQGANLDHSSPHDHHNPYYQTVLEWGQRRDWHGGGDIRDGRVWEYLYEKGLAQGKFLHEAITALRVDDVKHLITQGVDLNAQTHRGFTSLQVAAGVGRLNLNMQGIGGDEASTRTDIAQLLIEGGADVNLARRYTWRPLIEAIHNHNLAMVELFLANGADVRSPQGRDDKDALQIAQENYDKDNSDAARRIIVLLENHVAQYAAAE